MNAPYSVSTCPAPTASSRKKPKSVQSGRPRRPRRSPLAFMSWGQAAEARAARESDVMIVSSGQAAQGISQPLEFVVEIQGAPLGGHGRQPGAALVLRPDPHPDAAFADVEHREHAEHQQQAADIDDGLAGAAGHLEDACLDLLEA